MLQKTNMMTIEKRIENWILSFFFLNNAVSRTGTIWKKTRIWMVYAVPSLCYYMKNTIKICLINMYNQQSCDQHFRIIFY